MGAKSREAPTNLKPVGTGPYKFVDFKPGDMVARRDQPELPHGRTGRYFDAIEMKGGGDAVSAARAVLQTGEYDFAWNMQVEDEILQRLEKGGKGKVVIIARRQHRAHPAQHHRPVDRGRRRARRASRPSIRPVSDPAVRQALALLVDRDSVAGAHLRPHRRRHGNFVNNPERFRSKNTKWEFNVDKANAAARGGRLEEGRRRHPREGRQEAEVRLPDLDQRAAPEDPGDRQAGLPEGRHRDRAEGGDGVGVLLVRRRQPRHLPAVLLPTCRCTRRP